MIGRMRLPKSLKNIGINAFYNTVLTEITIPESVEKIGRGAFNEIFTLKTVNWNAISIESNEEHYFYDSVENYIEITYAEAEILKKELEEKMLIEMENTL